MTQLFNGKAVAKEKEKEIKVVIKRLRDQEIKLKLVSILVGHDTSSKLFLRLKKEAAERVGIKVEINIYPSNVCFRVLEHDIKRLNKDNSVRGIMLQLPLPKRFSKNDRDEIINIIDPKKDVDGLRADSPYTAPVVRAVLAALGTSLKDGPLKVVVVGYKGFEGRKIYKALSNGDFKRNLLAFSVVGVDKETKDLKSKTKEADVIISATGVQNLIKINMVKDSIVLIDVGAPKGDIDKACYKKASFVSPVPGGIGPLTIFYLLENLVKSEKMV